MNAELQYDYLFGIDDAITAGSNMLSGLVQGIGQSRGAKFQAEAQKEVAKTQSAADISKSFYDTLKLGSASTANISNTTQALLGAHLQRQASKDEVKKAQEKKYMYIGISLAVAFALGIGLYFFLNKKTPAAA